ncbi:MAG: Sir2 family NAD-dependent protein deacetylase [Candidatus Omnitrophica bacterium]|nr:Sir2 family NAD-dependent protein deacetylase [Candidatus Omnitrophota bacterium]
MTSDKIKTLFHFIQEARAIVVFTGAGISTESGIPDYRSQGGIWQRFQPVTIQEFLASHEKRQQYWQRKIVLFQDTQTAQPNEAHHALTALARQGKIKGLITQNIDGLHTKSGFPKDKILEIHGTNQEIKCLSCSKIYSWETVFQCLDAGQDVPLCPGCRGYLKPNTISFGQNLDVNILEKAFLWSRTCDLMLAIGSTLVVQPAAGMPRIARSHDARLVIITLSETPLDSIADLKFEESCSTVLQQVMQCFNANPGK